ncbi:nucleoside triphosphate pyrophosphohydrolase, partial [mine drainage metagenome]
RTPWPTAQAVAIYGPKNESLPTELLEAPDGTLHGRGGNRSGPVMELAQARREDEVLYVPPFGDRSALSFAAAKSVMTRLRAPDGCPWDREQTYQSLLPYLLEEAAEVYDAILGGNVHEMVEELGDLLLQVLFHAEIGEEEGRFSVGEIALALRDKLRRRHPHVFGDEHYPTAEQFLPRWEELKREEQQGRNGELSGLPRSLSSLAMAEKAIRRLHRSGVDEATDEGWLREFETAIQSGRDLEAEVRQEILALV